MTVAAQQLHTSQPNVSRIIGKLEAEVGFELFDRQPGRVLPTRAAEALFKAVSYTHLTAPTTLPVVLLDVAVWCKQKYSQTRSDVAIGVECKALKS